MVRIVKFLIVPVCVGTGATLLVLLRQTTYGGGFSVDSSAYINIARDIVNGYGIRDTLWFIPPGFPSLLALVSVFGPDPREVAPFVNATAFGLTVAVAGIWFRIHIKSRILVVWGTCAVAFSTALSFPATMAWTEAPFCLFVVLSLFSLDRYLSTCNRRVHPEKAGKTARTGDVSAFLFEHSGMADPGRDFRGNGHPDTLDGRHGDCRWQSLVADQASQAVCSKDTELHSIHGRRRCARKHVDDRVFSLSRLIVPLQLSIGTVGGSYGDTIFARPRASSPSGRSGGSGLDT